VTVLVDSDVLIEVSRERDSAIVSKWTDLSTSDHTVLCTPVSVAELWHGARPKEHPALTALFGSLLCVPITERTGRLAGDYLREFHRSHHLELADALIAATAVTSSASLWTRNRKHYPMKDLIFY